MIWLRITLVGTCVGLIVCNESLGLEIAAARGSVAKNPVATAWIQKGVLKLVKGDLGAARSCFDAAIKVEPTAWPAFHNRGMVSYIERKWDAAVSDFSASLRLHPGFGISALFRAYAIGHLGKCGESLAELKLVDEKVPLADTGQAMLVNLRARLHFSCADPSIHDTQAALSEAKIACRITHFKENEFIDTLAQVYAETGDFDSAVKYEQQAIAAFNARKKEVTTNTPETLKHLEKQLATFQQHHTSHDWY